MHLIKLLAVVALAAPLMGADTAPGLGTDTENASDAAKDAGGKAGTENGTGKGTENAAGAAKAGGTNTNANDADGSTAAGNEVQLDTLPAAVKSAVAKEAAAQEISTIRKRTAGGRTLYDVEVNRGGETETVCFDEKGTKLEKGARAR